LSAAIGGIIQLCTGDGSCVTAYPTQAISLNPWRVDLGKYLFCGLCSEVCPTQAIQMSSDVELATPQRSKLIVDGDGHPVHAAHLPEALSSRRPRELLPLAPEADLSGQIESLREQIGRTLRRSLHIRHVDSGSCNGCDWELTTLLNPIHDIQHYGIDFVASSRHADLLLVTGVTTSNLTLAAIRTYRATPGPRLVVAIGACGCSGGIFGTSYVGGGGTNTRLPVDFYIPGCPPHPQALIHSLLLAMGRIIPLVASAL
jgi:Ni,Fe-hydrogenase III small subunit/NAD-dependent dihydropyrimidine dehydrogenase PreA subunit